VIQCASDFLSEASAMARNCLGSYGSYISELFKILIDEYGYGVHRAKHSQAFVSLMESIGMNSAVHHYWQFYTASSLSLVNYFHYVCKNHSHFFKYLGALYYTEATLAHLTSHQARMLKKVFGDSVDTFYFDEHSHIDQHHARMVLEQLIKPIVHQYGEQALVEILAGFEEFRLVQGLADEDCARQIGYNTHLQRWKEIGMAQWHRLASQASKGQIFEEPSGVVSSIHCHEVDRLLVVIEGELEFIANPFCPITLRPGEAVTIPKHKVHGSKVLSPTCAYKVLAAAQAN
jgi:quercetin dioxygenase-like cupin family protein